MSDSVPSVNALLSQAEDLRLAGRYEEALLVYDRVLAILPHDELGQNNKAFSLFQLGRIEEAIAIFDDMLSMNSNDVTAWMNKAYALRALGRINEAEEAERLTAEANRRLKAFYES